MTSGAPAYRLTVAIPTYNRAECLRRLLTGVAGQIRVDALTAQVQICVSDNASPDHTQAVLESFRREYPDVALTTRRNDSNVGFIGNMRRAVEHAGGEYVALTGDDDTLRPEALRKILAASREMTDLILFNSLPGLGRWVRSLPLDDGTQRVFRDGCEANQALGIFHLSFLGNCVFRRSAFMASYSSDYDTSQYPHTYVAMALLSQGPALFVNYATFSVDDSRRDWWALQPWLTAIDMAKLQTNMVLSRGASRRDVGAVYRELARSVPRAVLHSRRTPGTIPVSPRDIWAGYRCSRFYQLLALTYWLGARALPVRLLDRLIRVFSTARRPVLP